MMKLMPRRVVVDTFLKRCYKAGQESTGQYPKVAKSGRAQIGPEKDNLTRYPELYSSKGWLRGIDYLGTVVFAVSGSITAGTMGMDLLGASIVGTITAIGGGTIRDALVLHKQPFWIEEYEYLLMAAGASALAFCVFPILPAGNLVKNDEGDEGELLWWVCLFRNVSLLFSYVVLQGDSLGLGAFAVIGAQNGLRMCVHPAIAVSCGMVTATFGGLTRDVLCGRPVENQGHGRILHSQSDMYAITALVGASMYVLTRSLALPMYLRILTGVGSTMTLRYAAKTFEIGLPSWNKPSFRTQAFMDKQQTDISNN